MNLAEMLSVAADDKVLIGLLGLVAGYLLNRRIETLKGGLAYRTALAPKRTNAYEALWKLTEPLAPRRVSDLDVSAAKGGCFADLRRWYYNGGNAMYLSLDAADLFLQGLELLESDHVRAEKTVELFSSLRTQLKVDLGVYSRKDARTRIPRSQRCRWFPMRKRCTKPGRSVAEPWISR